MKVEDMTSKFFFKYVQLAEIFISLNVFLGNIQ